MDKFLEKLGLKRARNKTTKTTNPNLVAGEVQNRIIVLGFIIFLSLAVIVGKLFLVQVSSNEAYIEKLAAYTRRFETITTPRGEFLDRNGNLIVGNEISKAIIYYPPVGHESKEKWEMAIKFSENFNVDESNLNKSDLQDLYMFLYKDEVDARISEKENADHKKGDISISEFHNLKKSKISEKDFEKLTVAQRKAYTIYQRMNMSTSGGMKMILSSVSNEEIAFLAENNLDYPGFESYTNWERHYLEDLGLRTIIGSVSTETQGLPAEKVDYYLAKDYSRNERIGRSGLELYYEDIVSGNKKVQDVVYSEDGFAKPIEVREGTRGDNIYLTIDMDLQKKVEEIALSYIERYKNDPRRLYFQTIHFVVSDPHNGDILASVAIKPDSEGNLYNDPSANHLDTIIPGSTIKGATVYLGLKEGVVSPYEMISDDPIKIAGTESKSSYSYLGATNAITSLSRSSNVYMYHVAMRVANARYQYNQPLYGVDMEDFHKFKQNFSSFGLGTKTGIDMPSEAEGYVGKVLQAGFLLDYAMGQFDSYSPMQLAAYVNTIANDGIRVKPRYVQYATDPITNIKVFENATEVVSILEDKEALGYVQQGFRACVTSGLCQGMNTSQYEVAAKTGTADNTYTTKEGVVTLDAPHSLLVSYAPYENPEISVVCAAPNATNGPLIGNICQPMASEVYDYYFNNK